MSFFSTTKRMRKCNTQNPIFQYFLMKELKNNIVLTSNVSIDDLIINVSPDHGFLVGESIVLWSNNMFIQSIVIAVNENTVTIDEPSPIPFTIQNTVVVRGVIDMVDDFEAESTNYIFKMYNSCNKIEITSVIITMWHALPADDGKFGGIPALTKGVLFRSTNEKNTNLGLYINNHSFKTRGASVQYTPSAPAGTHSTYIRFNILDAFGNSVSISPQKGEYLYAVLQDDLSDLNLMNISLLGSYM